MKRRFQTIGLTGKHTDPKVEESMRLLVPHLLDTGRSVLLDESVSIDFGPLPVIRRSTAALASESDLLVAIGGDGTMLYANRIAVGADLPLLGVNRGRLGFLADIGTDEMLDRVAEVLDGNYEEEHRLMLQAQILRGDQVVEGTALNDIVLQRRETGRMLDFETWIDGLYVNTHGGDGLVVATPTGSTAYALSGGGPILHPGVEAIALVPICPHTLSDRPLVVSANASIDVRLVEHADTSSEVICDGRSLGELLPGDTLRITRAEPIAILIHPLDHDYYRILRSKLHWGRGNRGQSGDNSGAPNSGPASSDKPGDGVSG
ncbi:MAG: NAD(+) kinase [Gammaproteobacteria bacterium]